MCRMHGASLAGARLTGAALDLHACDLRNSCLRGEMLEGFGFERAALVGTDFSAARLADAYHCVVLLKGARTVVAEQSRVYVNETGNPSMATAGSGDVLTGAVAALMAQGMTAFDAAALGAHVHGQAGDLWSQKHGKAGLTAIALANGLPDAINATRHQAT